MEVKLRQTSAARSAGPKWAENPTSSPAVSRSSTVAERRRIAKVVGGVRAGAALGDGVKANALGEMYLLGEDDGNEYRFWCYELDKETTASERVSAYESEDLRWVAVVDRDRVSTIGL